MTSYSAKVKSSTSSSHDQKQPQQSEPTRQKRKDTSFEDIEVVISTKRGRAEVRNQDEMETETSLSAEDDGETVEMIEKEALKIYDMLTEETLKSQEVPLPIVCTNDKSGQNVEPQELSK